MNFLDDKLEEFISKYSDKEPEVLYQLNRETWEKIINPRMLSGHLQGRVLSMLSYMIKPKRILEIGTYTGYSALCWLEGMAADGKLITIDVNEEIESMVRKYIKTSGLENRIEFIIGDATKLIPSLDGGFDIVFIDADKTNYCNYLDLVIDKVRPGGFIIADNVLWSGKVVEPFKTDDLDTKGILAYCEKVNADERLSNVIFPIRDGLLISRKK